VEAPPNICTPAHLARAAEEIAAGAPDVMACRILEREECAKLGMGCYLGVAECSDAPPKFIHLTYTPPGARRELCHPAIHSAACTFEQGQRKPPGARRELCHPPISTVQPATWNRTKELSSPGTLVQLVACGLSA
jgi:hypothetical protein